MEIGIFARTFARPSLHELLKTIAEHEVQSVQFNFSCVGLPTLPDEVSYSLLDHIREELTHHNLQLAAVSGTFNMVHPDPQVRRGGLKRFKEVLRASTILKAPIVTLCTGTRDPDNMWRPHLANDTPEAWADLVAGLEDLLPLAEDSQITLGVEPEHGNVISNPHKARRLLDELKSPRLKIVMDAANLFQAEDLSLMRETLDEAFDLLSEDIVLAHAKDTRLVSGQLQYLAAGKGSIDFPHYISLLKKSGFTGPLVLHELQESEVPGSVAFLRNLLKGTNQWPPSSTTA